MNLVWILLWMAPFTEPELPLSLQVGRNEVRIQSAPFPLLQGRTIDQIGLIRRLERLAYRRVGQKPTEPGEYFWGHEIFWIFRHGHRRDGRQVGPRLLGLKLRRADAMILGGMPEESSSLTGEDEDALYLEPELLAESWQGKRAPREPIAFERVPEHVWRAVLAAEDTRFFDHIGLDGRGIARSLAANLKAGKVVQGGSTITQQLIKNRDLTPKRTFGRKLSEAWRALMVEAAHDKREILESYLDHVYMGHTEGIAIYGFGSAARYYFSKPLTELNLAEGAAMAAMIQGPNRLSPLRQPQALKTRRDWVLGRMAELGWATREAVMRAQAMAVEVVPGAPQKPIAPHFLGWVSDSMHDRFTKRFERGRGFVVETTLDPYLQELAMDAVSHHLDRLRRRHSTLRHAKLAAVLLAIDLDDGAVLAHIGGDPALNGDQFDRARKARRQPGSTVKPFVLLEAFQRAGLQQKLNPASLVSDDALAIDLPSGPWLPENNDNKHHGIVDLRTATRNSYNLPFVRLSRWMGFDYVADRFRRAGFELAAEPAPSFVLGAIETSPLELLTGFTAIPNGGRRLQPYVVALAERPGGRDLMRAKEKSRRISGAASAYLVYDLLRDAVENGTGRPAAIEGVVVAGKTGTSSRKRDAWFVGFAGRIACLVWVGLDDDGELGLTGTDAAAPLWQHFMKTAAFTRAERPVERPLDVIEAWIDGETGLRVDAGYPKARAELFIKGDLPPKRRLWRRGRTHVIQ